MTTLVGSLIIAATTIVVAWWGDRTTVGARLLDWVADKVIGGGR